MKKITLYLSIALLFLYSCKKSNSGSAPSSNYYLSSVVAIVPNDRIVDSFYYDTLQRINTFSQNDYDTGFGSSYVNTWSVQFIYQGSNTWPSSYNYIEASLGGVSGSHLLSYDEDHRIIKDTCLNGTGNYTHFSYTDNNIVISFFNGGTILPASVNTLVISNGNISQESPYAPPVQSGSLGVDHFTYATVANPAYHPLISNSIGPLLTALNFSTGGIVDFMSKNAWQGSDEPVSSSQPDLSTSYTLDTDNKGRLTEMTLNAGSDGGWPTILFSFY